MKGLTDGNGGRGNYSVVKLATEKGTGKEWAAKIITKKDAGPKGLQMLQTEVDILHSCDHPNVVRLHEVYETDEHYYIIMELYLILSLLLIMKFRVEDGVLLTIMFAGLREVNSSIRSFNSNRTPNVTPRASSIRSSARLIICTNVASFTAVPSSSCGILKCLADFFVIFCLYALRMLMD